MTCVHPSVCPEARAADRYKAERDEARAEVERLRAGIAWAQGMCSDAEPHEAISAFLSGVLTRERQTDAPAQPRTSGGES